MLLSWKKNCLVRNSLSTTRTRTNEPFQESFKIQSCPLTSDSEEVLHLLKYKVSGVAHMLGKAKLSCDVV